MLLSLASTNNNSRIEHEIAVNCKEYPGVSVEMRRDGSSKQNSQQLIKY